MCWQLVWLETCYACCLQKVQLFWLWLLTYLLIPVIFLKVILVLNKFTETVSFWKVFVAIWLVVWNYEPSVPCSSPLWISISMEKFWIFVDTGFLTGYCTNVWKLSVSEPWSATFEQCDSNQIKVTQNTELRGKANFLPLSDLKLKSEGHCWGFLTPWNTSGTLSKWVLLQRQAD